MLASKPPDSIEKHNKNSDFTWPVVNTLSFKMERNKIKPIKIHPCWLVISTLPTTPNSGLVEINP